MDSKEIIDREYAQAEALVCGEIEKYRESRYWVGSAERHVSSLDDYDRKRFAADIRASFPHLHIDAIVSLIDLKIYHLHLR